MKGVYPISPLPTLQLNAKLHNPCISEGNAISVKTNQGIPYANETLGKTIFLH